MVTHATIRSLASKLFGCSPDVVLHVEVGEEEHAGARVNFVEVYHHARHGRANRGARTDERIARTPFLGPYYDGTKQVEAGQNRAEEALGELLRAELAAKGAA